MKRKFSLKNNPVKNIPHFFTALLFLALTSCSNPGAADRTLAPVAFADSLKATPNALLLDVRTPEEFAAGGHLEGAQNLDFKDPAFEANAEKLDKAQPLFVYCLSGNRSGLAAQKLRDMGFQNVHAMDGGLLLWRSLKMPEVTNQSVTPTDAQPGTMLAGMTKADYDREVASAPKVLVDFQAEWCGPCKAMAPFIKEMEADPALGLKVVRIDADANPALCTALGVDALPTLEFFRNGKKEWSNKGFVPKEALLEVVK